MNKYITSLLFFILCHNIAASKTMESNDIDLDISIKNSNGRGYSSKKFNEWLLKVSYDKQNIPTYTFFTKAKKRWKKTRSKKSEYMYNGDNSIASSSPLMLMKYYQYRGKNPLLTPEETSQLSKLMNRFYFYRYTAKGGGIVNLDNYLIAVDTYTKFVYRYAKPIEFKEIFGNKVPQKFGAFEIYNSDKGHDYKFYEYDPIGFVNPDGTVELYDYYVNNEVNKVYEPEYSGASPYAKKTE